jgi:hypothetical protein
MNLEFETTEELKKRITPALKTKLKELKKENYKIIDIEDIWNFLIKEKWKKAKDLTLYDIINDILNLDNEEIEEYAIKRREKNDKN